ncbi:MAG: outer membrane protein [Bauldia sp.]
MGRSKIYALLLGASAIVPAANAFAADIPEVPPPVQFHGGWYLRGDIGFSNQHVGSLFNILYDDVDSVTNVSKDFSAAPFFGLGIGFQHSDHLRFDLTGEYRGGSTFHGLDIYTDPDPATDEYTAIKSEWTFLANGYWDIGTWKGFTPFVGAGLGVSYNTISGFTDVNTPLLGVAYGATASEWNFAWALHAGLSYKVNDRLTIEAAYRYLDLGNAHTGDLVTFEGDNDVPNNPMEFHHLYSHDIKVGFRWAFDAPQQSYYPPVVKY